jgi:hypothetical protein
MSSRMVPSVAFPPDNMFVELCQVGDPEGAELESLYTSELRDTNRTADPRRSKADFRRVSRGPRRSPSADSCREYLIQVRIHGER